MVKVKYFVLFMFMVVFTVGCAPKNINDLPPQQRFVEYSVRTWSSVDITADTIYSIFGELYKDGQITEEQKDTLIEIGNPIASGLKVSKKAIESYMWAMNINSNVESSQQMVINSLVVVVQAFYELRDEAEEIYKLATGEEIDIPDLVLFDQLTSALISED